MTNNLDDFLEHHGIKGMHWGVRHDRQRSGRHEDGGNSSSAVRQNASSAFNPSNVKMLAAGVEKLTDRDKSVLKAVGMSPMQAEAMKAKYGPDSNKPEKKRLTPAQKKLIVYGAIGLGVAGLIVYGNVKAKGDLVNSLVKDGGYDKDAAKAFLKSKPEEAKGLAGLLQSGIKKPTADYLLASDQQKATNLGEGLTKEALAKFSHEDLTFPEGHVFKRISTEMEKEIRPSGFFAAHSDEDTERYKAVLPVYWKIWNPLNPPTSGYVNHYAASTSIKVANEGTIYDTLKNSLDDILPYSGGIKIRDYLSPNVSYESDDELVRDKYYDTLAQFVNTENPIVKHLSQKFKDAGYHGIIDSNDAGSLSAQPIKFLDGSVFKIVGHEKLSAQGISDAQNSILALKHILAMMLSRATGDCVLTSGQDVENFLEHHGVKGMKWGVRHDRYRLQVAPPVQIDPEIHKSTRDAAEEDLIHSESVPGEEIRVFLEHYGVKGMHWGVRKIHSTSNDPNASRAVRTAQTINRHQIGFAVAGAGLSVLAARHGYRALPIVLGTVGAIAVSNIAAQKHAEAGKKAVADMGVNT